MRPEAPDRRAAPGAPPAETPDPGSRVQNRADRWRRSLILVLTRRCNLRCAYCPTVKEGLPDLTLADARRARSLFLPEGGETKLFGGEPLLCRETVLGLIADSTPEAPVYLSTNGMHLDAEILAALRSNPSVTLTVSLDGTARDHDGLRRAPGQPSDPAASHAAVLRLLPDLLALPRFVVTQTIAPSTAARAADNFRYLRRLGIRRFNLLPGYYLPWRPEQLAALAQSFLDIGQQFSAAWEAGEFLYLRNLFVLAPTPFYNTGLVVDCDRRIYASNLILAGTWDDLRQTDAIGTLDHPPGPGDLVPAAARAAAQIHARLSPGVRQSTEAVDRLLTALCHQLYPAYFQWRERRAHV